MILGILSDTHGNLPRTEAALRALNDAGADHLIHCGDLGGEDVVTLLFEQQEAGTPVTAVVGNVDEWDAGLRVYAKKLGIPLPRIARIDLDGITAAVCHGHTPRDIEDLITHPDIHIVFTGHTHVPRDEQVDQTRILNPGALHRAAVPGYALFDTATHKWTRIAL
ncbi:MAG: metallophosphoesterase family protein [Verrucomicrobia bacterium]|nr:metallophosphoesterase family protein [Verrucomicrobiota bacterium]MCH8526580.1 YfcE family phosphodiesterase [Kiritimatiellia bacterium]